MAALHVGGRRTRSAIGSTSWPRKLGTASASARAPPPRPSLVQGCCSLRWLDARRARPLCACLAPGEVSWRAICHARAALPEGCFHLLALSWVWDPQPARALVRCFRTRRPGPTVRPRERRNKLLINEYKVDLHGLDAAQAVDALHDTLAKFSGEHSAPPDLKSNLQIVGSVYGESPLTPCSSLRQTVGVPMRTAVVLARATKHVHGGSDRYLPPLQPWSTRSSPLQPSAKLVFTCLRRHNAAGVHHRAGPAQRQGAVGPPAGAAGGRRQPAPGARGVARRCECLCTPRGRCQGLGPS